MPMGRAGRWRWITRSSLKRRRPRRAATGSGNGSSAWSRHEVPKPGNTGHVVFVDQKPEVEKDGLVRVVVIDSTTLPSADISGDKGKSGIGRRTMWFTVDKDGRPVGYVRGKRTAKPKVEAISIGRALPTKAKISTVRRAA